MNCCLYLATNKSNGKEYVGMTNNLNHRIATHKSVTSKQKTPFGCAIKKYGIDSFEFKKLVIGTREYIEVMEVCFIAIHNPEYNWSTGGEGGFVVMDKVSWIKKLSKARVGRTPALGMKHTEETKRLCALANKRKQLKYTKIALLLPFKEANTIYGVSKTHYYRLRRQVENKIN